MGQPHILSPKLFFLFFGSLAHCLLAFINRKKKNSQNVNPGKQVKVLKKSVRINLNVQNGVQMERECNVTSDGKNEYL